MAAPTDFVPIRLTQKDERDARKRMRDMLGRSWWRKNRVGWVGFAAETALARAVNASSVPVSCLRSKTLAHDLDLHACGKFATIEVKTRAAVEGWTHPEKFQYVVVPMHDGREPIKDVDLVWFCWYSMSRPRLLWVLGYCRGLAEFKRRAVWYAEGDPLPRGGWARGGGAYAIDVKDLRPMPRGLFKEEKA